MAKLDDLMPDMTKMTTNDLLEYVRGIRNDRKISKHTKKPAARKKTAASKTKLKKLLADMTPEQRKELLGG